MQRAMPAWSGDLSFWPSSSWNMASTHQERSEIFRDLMELPRLVGLVLVAPYTIFGRQELLLRQNAVVDAVVQAECGKT